MRTLKMIGGGLFAAGKAVAVKANKFSSRLCILAAATLGVASFSGQSAFAAGATWTPPAGLTPADLVESFTNGATAYITLGVVVVTAVAFAGWLIKRIRRSGKGAMG